ncbi:MAG: hypothetical protein RBT71_08710 [Flavobacteriales bacterium]|jgi:hypothetical protein|nr:hypothetical protein [Flavobacteriales bacterium]
MDPTKRAVVAHLHRLLAEKVAASADDIAATRAAMGSDTKSSAGDKHEVGRAMMQQELDKQAARHARLLAWQSELRRLPWDHASTTAGPGSLVATDQGDFLIGIGLGTVQVEGRTCHAVSPASPIGQALMGRAAGDVLEFNGRRATVRRVV